MYEVIYVCVSGKKCSAELKICCKDLTAFVLQVIIAKVFIFFFLLPLYIFVGFKAIVCRKFGLVWVADLYAFDYLIECSFSALTRERGYIP